MPLLISNHCPFHLPSLFQNNENRVSGFAQDQVAKSPCSAVGYLPSLNQPTNTNKGPKTQREEKYKIPVDIIIIIKNVSSNQLLIFTLG